MEEFGEAVTACVVALAAASYAQFGVRLERPPEPPPRVVQSVSPRRLQRVSQVAVVQTRAPRSRYC